MIAVTKYTFVQSDNMFIPRMWCFVCFLAKLAQKKLAIALAYATWSLESAYSVELGEGEWIWNMLDAIVSLSTYLFIFALHFLVFRVNKLKMMLNNRDSIQFFHTNWQGN